MEITCSKCNSSFVLPDDRVPEAKKFKLNCPKCREPIVIDNALNETHVAPEYFPRDAIVAFLFLPEPRLRQRVGDYLKSRGIFISEASNIVEAMDKIAINYYNIMILDDSSNTQTLLKVVRKWNGLRRREINIIQLGVDCPSLHGMEAFYRGVNAVISRDDADRVDHMLGVALGEYDNYIDLWNSAAQRIQGGTGRS